MYLFCLVAFCIGMAFVASAAAVILGHMRMSRTEKQFNEFFVCLVLYELGTENDSSMPLGILREILPCHPDEVDELIAFLESERAIEIDASRVRLGVRPYLLIETGNWRRAFSLPIQRKLEAALGVAKSKLQAGFGLSRAA